MPWLLDIHKSDYVNFVANKLLNASLRVVLQDATRLLACGTRIVGSKQRKSNGFVSGICSDTSYPAE